MQNLTLKSYEILQNKYFLDKSRLIGSYLSFFIIINQDREAKDRFIFVMMSKMKIISA